MKSALSITSLILIGLTCIGQNTMFDSNFVWTESYSNAFSQSTSSKRFTISPTPTEFDNLIYHEILSSNSFTGEDWSLTSNFIRTTFESRVYLRRHDKVILLYDFNAQPGDLFLTYHDAEIEVTDVDTVIISNGESRRRLQLMCTQIVTDPVYWIEGIGSTMDFDQISVCQFDWYTTLLCAYFDGELIYKNPEEDTCWLIATNVKELQPPAISVFPNPFDSQITVNTGESLLLKINISDMTGRIVYSGAENEIQLNDISTGYYTMEVITTEGSITNHKLVKQ